MNQDDLYEVATEAPDYQIPDYEQPKDFGKIFACDDYQGHIERTWIDIQETARYRDSINKKKKEKKDIFMREGNKAFRERNYKKALKCYDKAIDNVMDSCVLYTNRAMTYLMLGKPRNALFDANSALYWNPESLKALIYKAQALFLLKNTIESDLIIAQACQLHPGKVKIIKSMQQKWESS